VADYIKYGKGDNIIKAEEVIIEIPDFGDQPHPLYEEVSFIDTFRKGVFVKKAVIEEVDDSPQ
jgi:hypothetical protein